MPRVPQKPVWQRGPSLPAVTSGPPGSSLDFAQLRKPTGRCQTPLQLAGGGAGQIILPRRHQKSPKTSRLVAPQVSAQGLPTTGDPWLGAPVFAAVLGYFGPFHHGGRGFSSSSSCSP